MLLGYHALHEELMNKFTTFTPMVRVLHQKDVIPVGYEVVANIRCWTMVVNARLLINKLLHKPGRGNDNACGWAKLEREDASIFFCPFREPVFL